MPIFRLPRDPDVFPDPRHAEPDGLLAVGGDLSPRRLLAAYAQGIFPWFDETSPILWWSPDPRLVLEPEWLHASRSLERTLRRRTFRITADTAFAEVIARCSSKYRPSQQGTWITPEMREAYDELHRLGYAHSFEAWNGDTLAGGLYGVSLGRAFFGESMFADRADASKAAFVTAVRWLQSHAIRLVDCQVRTEHLVSLGAREVPRAVFLSELARALRYPPLRGKWNLDLSAPLHD